MGREVNRCNTRPHFLHGDCERSRFYTVVGTKGPWRGRSRGIPRISPVGRERVVVTARQLFDHPVVLLVFLLVRVGGAGWEFMGVN